MPDTHEIVELREGGDVRAAVVLPGHDARVRLLLASGREMLVPRSRIILRTGETLEGSGARLATALGAWEALADDLARTVDVPALHDLLAGQDDPGREQSLRDLAGLALADEGGLARAAVHRALAAAGAWFRFSGDAFAARPREEVDAELAKIERAATLARERVATVAAARARLRGEPAEIPPGGGKFLRALRDVALLGDQSKLRKEAVALASEIEQRDDLTSLTGEHAFDMLVALGEFSPDENLALLRAGVTETFPDEVLVEAAEAARRDIFDGRRDLRAIEIVTVDDEHTREVDDGVSWEPRPFGVRLGVHIADAAHFVAQGSAVDRDAEARATSYYIPGRKIRMLPPVLSEDAASLVEGQDRPALSFFADITPHGEILRFEVEETIIRVRRRMTYEDCERALVGEGGPDWLPPLAELASRLEQERLDRGATPIRAHEVDITFDDAGDPVIELVDPGRPARVLVAELMVLTNRLAAQWCQSRGLPAIYRKQSPPTGAAPPPPRDRIDPLAAHEFRRTLSRTEVSLEAGPHAGLGVPCYLQATSPLRRYQDLVQHRIIKASLRGQPLPFSREELMGLAHLTEQAGRQARGIETETDRYWILRALEMRTGDTFDALVLRAESRHTLVQLLDFGYITPLASRPDHAPGQRLRVRVRASRPRRATLTLEEVTEGRG